MKCLKVVKCYRLKACHRNYGEKKLWILDMARPDEKDIAESTTKSLVSLQQMAFNRYDRKTRI